MNILLIMPFFNDYEKEIYDYLTHKGNKVVLVSDSIKISLLNTIERKIFMTNYSFRFELYFKKILKSNISECFDKIIMIFGGYFIREKHIKILKEKWPNAELIYYCWDSITNFSNILRFCNLFDRKYSFDLSDCSKYNFDFLPLFYLEVEKKENIQKKYDISAIYTFDRYKYLKIAEIIRNLPPDLNIFHFIYMPSVKTYWLNKIFLMFKGVNIRKNEFSFKKINLKEAESIYQSSRCVLDCPLQNQKGLTIRCFESLSNKTKVITTNEEILKYPFYNEENVFLYEPGKKIRLEFIKNDFQEFLFTKNYSLETFLSVLVNNDKVNYF